MSDAGSDKSIFPDIPPYLDDGSTNELDVIYHNMDLRSDFRTMRTQRGGTIDGQMQRMTQHIERGCFHEVISVSASKHTFVAVVCTALSQIELEKRGFPL
jgi:hypothetical protein